MQSVIINQEFKNLIPPQTDEEHARLESMIVSEGCRDSLVVWGGVLVDGHNRYEICTRLNLPYTVVEREFADSDAVCDWIEQNQLSRRNLTPSQISFIIGRRYERTKKAITNPDGLGGKTGKIDDGQNVHQQSTSQTIAAEYGLNEKTVRRYGQEAALIDQHPEKAQEVIQGTKKKKEVIRELTGKPSLRSDNKQKEELPKKLTSCQPQNLCHNYAIMAMTNLDRIQKRDPQGAGALMEVMDYIKLRLDKEFTK